MPKSLGLMINDYVKRCEMVYITRNSNLRDSKFFYPGDSKHIRQECIGKFAANIKFTLRLAYGRKKYSLNYSNGAHHQYNQQKQDQYQHQSEQHTQQQYNHLPNYQQTPKHQPQQLQNSRFGPQNSLINVPNAEQFWLNNGILNNIISEAVRRHAATQ